MIKRFNNNIKRLTIWDIKLITWYGIFIGLFIVKLLEPICGIMKISIWWFLVLAVIFVARPCYLIWFKK